MSKSALRVAGDLALGHGHRLLGALGATWRMRHAGGEQVSAARSMGPAVLFVFTHGVILPLAYAHRGRGAVVLISESRDGEIITRIVERMGFVAVRGSSTRGGERAVAELARLARSGKDLAITPDGPKGPRGSVAPGTMLVASRAEIPIVPVGVSADRAWRASSWDRFLVPQPGARVAVVYGAPLRVAREPTAEAAHAVEHAMQDVERRAEELLHTGFRGASTTKVAP